MKRFHTIYFFSVLMTFSLYNHAQTPPASFLKKYNSAKTNREKGESVLNYIIYNIDSTRSRGLSLLSYFNKHEDHVGTDYTKLFINFTQLPTGDFSNTLKESFDILERCEKRKDEYGKMWSFAVIANSFLLSKNYDEAIIYFKKELAISKLLNDSLRFINNLNEIGYTYALANMPDSGLVYAQKAVDLSDSYRYNLAYSLSTLGENYIAKKEYEKALPIIRKSYTYVVNDAFITAAILNDFADCFVALNEKDSVLYYTQHAIEISKSMGYKDQLLHSYENLYRFFDKIHKEDSSNKYFRLAMIAKDSLFNIEKIKLVQYLAFTEQLRQQEEAQRQQALQNKLRFYSLLTAFVVILIIAIIYYRNNKQKQKTNALLQQQKEKVESTLQELEATQSQLIQSEKMASLGELTAGIAHEIQNPLNFVNNFSEVNKELIDELQQEVRSGNAEEVISISNDIKENEEKILHHGKRADAIVKGMLQHSRVSTGKKEPIDINALTDEYLRLSYHGMRAKDKNFNVEIKTDFDETIEKINVVPQDIGRVLLNLFNNAFYAVMEKSKNPEGFANPRGLENYKPNVSVQTKKENGNVVIKVADNGTGIPQKVIDKIFQPFFTTKPTGQGTGLGLSLSYDIIKAHGGEIKVESKEGEGSEFIVQLLI